MPSMLRATPLEDAVLDSLPEGVFGSDGWAINATHQIVHHLRDAVASGQSSRFANAIRMLGHVPTTEHVRTIARSVCDSAIADAAIAGRDSERVIGMLSLLRDVADDALDGMEAERPRGNAVNDATTACDTLLQVVAVSRPDLLKHLEAVSSLSMRIGRQLELADETIERSRLGALLHDIGLLTAGTEPALAERDPGHMTLSDRCLNGIAALKAIAPIVRAHHERFDGEGKPDGLQGAEIPIEARIINVADAFEQFANRSGRANPIAAAISELWQESSTVYDPDVVVAVTRLFNQHWRDRRTASGAL